MTIIENEHQSGIDHGLDFILTHFQEPVWPRTISTKSTQGRQIEVFNKEEVLASFEDGSLLDCRINAYRSFTEYKGINRQSPDFIFIDLDRSNFKTERAHQLALNTTLKNIEDKLGGNPTVIWSGNGYHIYQPIEAFVLEQVNVFSQFDQPSKKFLRFAEKNLSNNKCDPAHNTTISFKNCMVRVPGTYNSKNSSAKSASSEIRMIHEWNGYRPPINYLLCDFYVFLADQKIKELQETQKRNRNEKKHRITSSTIDIDSIPWIERLLKTPIEDGRKFVIWRVLAPYLLNVRKLSLEKASDIMKEWLSHCNEIRRLDFNANLKIKEAIKGASKGYLPVGLAKLKDENNKLTALVTSAEFADTLSHIIPSHS